MHKSNALGDGEYIITSVKFKNVVVLPDANGGTSLSAHQTHEIPEGKVYTSQRSSFTLIPKRVLFLVVHQEARRRIVHHSKCCPWWLRLCYSPRERQSYQSRASILLENPQDSRNRPILASYFISHIKSLLIAEYHLQYCHDQRSLLLGFGRQ